MKRADADYSRGIVSGKFVNNIQVRENRAIRYWTLCHQPLSDFVVKTREYPGQQQIGKGTLSPSKHTFASGPQ
ncbi:hypothetical protein KSZ_55220 [Dictyobacter formicarum]|uniref:Uncharacterized protein n=1 Tax=Dictyobacter formicarum TaxID=2778368 RepID=A0ABQ3VPB4_9CHLR|nr:hypothetical protein KSZ_55220 [Dictyobacter formicarum]